MKLKSIFLVLIVGGILSSCSKCYECTYEIEIESGGTTTTTTSDPKEYCTTSGEEIDELENDGYTCTSTGA